MAYKGEQQVVDDKYKRQLRDRRAREEAEALAQRRSELAEAQVKAKAEADYNARERPFNEEVAARLAEYQNKKTTQRG